MNWGGISTCFGIKMVFFQWRRPIAHILKLDFLLSYLANGTTYVRNKTNKATCIEMLLRNLITDIVNYRSRSKHKEEIETPWTFSGDNHWLISLPILTSALGASRFFTEIDKRCVHAKVIAMAKYTLSHKDQTHPKSTTSFRLPCFPGYHPPF